MALVRVYCGISSTAEGGLPFAVVDDSGRLLEYLELTDDAAGYATVTAMLAERFGGSTMVMIAVDTDDHLLVSLLAAAGRLIAYTDDETADDFAERFADDESMDEVNATLDERRAVGLARALQAGALSGGVAPAPREFAALKPLLAAHAAVTTGRHAAAVALREVLRELYPAALRAYPDPAETVALAMLDALPEPSLLAAAAGKGRDAAVTVAARLVADGICDNATALEAVTALRVAITETPRRNGVAKQLTTAVADVVRSSVAAVRSADTASTILIHTLNERIAPKGVPAATPAMPRRRAQPAPITTPMAPPRAPVLIPQQVAVSMAAVQQVVPQPVAAQQMPPQRPAWAANTPPPPTPPGFEPTPVTGIPMIHSQQPVAQPLVQPMAQAAPAPAIPSQRAAAMPQPTMEPLAPFVPTVTHAVISQERAVRGIGSPPPPLSPPAAAAQPVSPAAPISRENWPLIAEPEDDVPVLAPVSPGGGRITPPWQADDLVPPPSLRLVEQTPPAEPGVRLVDDSALTARIPKPRRVERSPERSADDTDLLIFSSIPSAWFDRETEGESTWNSALDAKWRAAELASLHPSSGPDTTAGLPQRVPQANLVAGTAQSDRPLRIVRDAASVAEHTSSYFRGWRRGNQEAGGYALGGRPGRESANGWDFSREHELRDDRGEYGQRAANYR